MGFQFCLFLLVTIFLSTNCDFPKQKSPEEIAKEKAKEKQIQEYENILDDEFRLLEDQYSFVNDLIWSVHKLAMSDEEFTVGSNSVSTLFENEIKTLRSKTRQFGDRLTRFILIADSSAASNYEWKLSNMELNIDSMSKRLYRL